MSTRAKIQAEEIRLTRENGTASSGRIEDGTEEQYAKLKQLDYIKRVGKSIFVGEATEVSLILNKHKDDTIYYSDRWNDVTLVNKNGKYKTIGGDYLIQLISCDCGEKKISLGKTITYNKNGDVLQEFNYDSPFEYVIPETQGEEILNIVCGWSEYAIDIELKKLYSEYSKIFDEIDEETFYNSYNQFGEVYLNLVREKIKKNK